jgi:large subunit ribosomal protein L7/L12
MDNTLSLFNPKFKMKNSEILEQLKSITLLEAAELVSQIEECFGVDVTGRYLRCKVWDDGEYDPLYEIVLEKVPVDNKIAVIRVLRNLTDWTLPQVKKFVEAAPKLVEKGVYGSKAEDIKRQLEAAGAKVSLKPGY